MGIKIWWPTLFVLVIGVVCVLILPSDLRLADLMGRAGKFQEAIERHKKILAAEPDRTDARLRLSELYLMNQEPEKAVAEIDKIGIGEIQDPYILKQSADVYAGLAQKEKNLATLERLNEIVPDDPDYRERLAESYVWNSKTAAAITAYAEILKTRPHDAGLLNRLARLSLDQNDTDTAIHYFNRSLELDSENTETRLLLADIYIAKKQKSEAVTHLEQILADDPNNEIVRERLAELYIWMQDFDLGIQHYEYLVSHDFENEKVFHRFTELTYKYFPDKAIQYHLLRLDKTPDDFKLREKLVDIYLHIGDADLAVAQMKTLIEQNPDRVDYRKHLAYLYQDIREPRLANEMFEQIYDRDDDRETFDELIVYYRFEKEYDKLLNLYHSVAQTEGVNPETIEDYAQLLIRTGRHDKATEQYEKLLRIGAGHSEYRIALAELYDFKGRESQATELLWDGITKYNQNETRFLLFCANFFYKHEAWQPAIDSYEKLIRLEPDNLQHKKNLASLYAKTKDFGRTQQLYKEILQKSPDLSLSLELASYLWLEGDSQGMKEVLTDARLSYADRPDIDKRMGQFYFERGFFEETISHIRTQLHTTPRDSLCQRILGLAYAWNNHPGKAKPVLISYLVTAPGDYSVQYQLGEIYLSERNWPKAHKAFRKALIVLKTHPGDREAKLVEARIYSRFRNEQKVSEAFDVLFEQSPGDLNLFCDYGECLINLKAYDRAGEWLQKVPNSAPQNYRANRLLSRSYYEQGKYREAARTLHALKLDFSDDTSLALDLSDAELASGDWFASTKILKSVLDRFPNNLSAQERLIRLRRTRSERFGAEYKSAQQGDNFFKQFYQIAVSKAKSSLLQFKLWFGEEKYEARNNTVPDREYKHFRAGISSSINAKLATEIGAQAQSSNDTWYLSGHGSATWRLTPENTVTLSGDVNELWDDPFSAALLGGRRHRLRTEFSLRFWQKAFLWGRLDYESHLLNSASYGKAVRTNIQAGYRWRQQPDFSTYYQLYHLNYDYANASPSPLLVPERDEVHALGGALLHEVTRNLFYEVYGSIGLNTVRNAVTYYGTLGLEYTLINRLRFRSLVEYGSQNQLSGADKNTSLIFDFSYFY